MPMAHGHLQSSTLQGSRRCSHPWGPRGPPPSWPAAQALRVAVCEPLSIDQELDPALGGVWPLEAFGL